ncbi:hypothetical protein ACIO3O_27365 [Streptomyces sp. NPDC087440]|uniref:hypothetical protein n=1 Tax=Streptomyces sp. NPDC087440 TaxID=3365790 RepID=UPI00381C2D53
MPRVRVAVEEFCVLRTGARPEAVGRVAGHVNGQRSHRPDIVDFVEDPEIDWDLLR